MAAEIVKMPGAGMARGGGGDDDNALREWLVSEVTPDRPEGDIDRVTLHRADAQGHVKSRLKTVQLKGKSGDRLNDVATEIALAAERDARSPLGAPIYIARLWTGAAGAEPVSELPIVPSQAGPRFAEATSNQMQGALLGQAYNHNETLFRGSVAMMVAMSEHASRECERLQAEANLLREKARQDAADLEAARERRHEREMEMQDKQAQLARSKEVFDLVKGGIDAIMARWAPAGTPTSTVIAEKVVAFVDGLDKDTRAKMVGAFSEKLRARFEGIVEMARDGAGDTQLGKRLVRFFDDVPDDQRMGMFSALSQAQQMKVGAIAELAAKAAKVDVSDASEEKKP